MPSALRSRLGRDSRVSPSPPCSRPSSRAAETIPPCRPPEAVARLADRLARRLSHGRHRRRHRGHRAARPAPLDPAALARPMPVGPTAPWPATATPPPATPRPERAPPVPPTLDASPTLPPPASPATSPWARAAAIRAAAQAAARTVCICCQPCCEGRPAVCTAPVQNAAGIGVGKCPLPDLAVNLNALQTRLGTGPMTFAANSCEARETCVAQPGTRNTLHFEVLTPNIGTADLILGTPAGQARLRVRRLPRALPLQQLRPLPAAGRRGERGAQGVSSGPSA